MSRIFLAAVAAYVLTIIPSASAQSNLLGGVSNTTTWGQSHQTRQPSLARSRNGYRFLAYGDAQVALRNGWMITGSSGLDANGYVQSIQIQWVTRRGTDGAWNQHDHLVGLNTGRMERIDFAPGVAAQHYNNAVRSANRIAEQVRNIDLNLVYRGNDLRLQRQRNLLMQQWNAEQRLMATLRGR